MSNYTITTDFGAKDSLPSSNDSKVVRGSEFTTEFTSIQTAIATKADTAGDTFTGVVNFSADVAVNTNTLFVDVSEAKVGIGTTSPSDELTIRGAQFNTTQVSIGDNSDRLRLGYIHSNALESNTSAGQLATTSNSNLLISAPSNNASNIALYTNSASGLPSERMRIDSSGNVGIGATIPTSTLHVKAATADLNIQSDDGQSATLTFGDVTDTNRGGIEYASTDDLIFKNNNLQTRMVIRYTGDVGIGTSSPNESLVVKGGTYAANQSGGMALQMGDTSGSHWQSSFKIKSDGSGNVRTTLDATTGAIGGQSQEVISINTAGNVGIGTTGPDSTLHVKDTDTAVVHISGANTSAELKLSAPIPKITLEDTSTSAVDGEIKVDGNAMQFSMNTEAMRIDSSGNVLVGTPTQFGTDGISLNQSGWFYVRRTSDKAATFRLDGDDGNIITFDKEGSTVGSIGSEGGRPYLASSTLGIRVSNALFPCNTSGVITDGACDIGNASGRFKDLYLSGGVHLGGTGSANKLDDYEEGTWTPVIYGSTGGTGSGTIVNAKYTKVGGLVQVMCYINSYDVTGLSGAVRLSGLPFNSNGYHISVIGYCNMFSTDEASVSVSGYTESGSDKIYLTKGSSTTVIPASEATNSGGQLMLNFTYATTS